MIAWALDAVRGWRSWRVWIAAMVAAATAALHPWYFQSRLGLWTGLCDAIDRHWPSFRELTVPIFDPNLRILVHDPLLFSRSRSRSLGRRRVPAADPSTPATAPSRSSASSSSSASRRRPTSTAAEPGPNRWALARAVCHSDPRLCSDGREMAPRAGGRLLAWCAWVFAPAVPRAMPCDRLRPTCGADGRVSTIRWRKSSRNGSQDGNRRVRRLRPTAARNPADWRWIRRPHRPARCTLRSPPEFCLGKDALCYTEPNVRRICVRPGALDAGVARPRDARGHTAGVRYSRSHSRLSPETLMVAIWHKEGWSYPERLADPTADVMGAEWRWDRKAARVSA